MSLRQKEVQKSVAKWAESYGNKSANLIELSDICKTIQETEPRLKAQVPSICPLSHEIIYNHLSTYAPDWKKLWADFGNAQRKDDKELSETAREVIRKLQELILKTFEAHPIPDSVVSQYLKQLNCDVDLLMVRSTGKEDSKDLANPGGNESVAAIKADTKSISDAIGIVVASYFSEKSLKQRLLGKDDITQPPFIPVLLQKMEGEALGGSKKMSEVICSGVMYTGKRGTRIQTAPGHGELIVNSKAPFDSNYVTREGVVHSEIREKTKRLIPAEIKTDTGKKRILEMIDNSKKLATTPTLSQPVVRRLAKIGESIENHYGEPMDVEFVYDPARDVINIVQARPIPVGDLHLFPPSSINPEKLTLLKEITTLKKGSVITAGGSAAKVITSKDEIIVCQTIEEALNIYLAQKDSKVKAVIVKNDAPETSHEAAQFNSKAIPVLRMDDIISIQDWVKENNIAIIVDPQRKQIVDISKYAEKIATNKTESITKEFIQEGIFKSTMTAQETILPLFPARKFKPSTFYRKPKKIPIGKLLNDIHDKKSAVADEAFNNLMRTLFEVIKEAPKKTANFKEMPALLEEIENAIPGENNKKAIETLQSILSRFISLTKSLDKEIPQENKESHLTKESVRVRKDLFKQAMITGAEIYHVLQELSHKDRSDDASNVRLLGFKEKEELKAKRIELLNLVVKLEALISAPPRSGLYSGSLYQWALERRLRKNAEKITGFNLLSPNQQEYFIAMLQLKNVALDKPISDAWTQFALKICQDSNKLVKLNELILFMQKFDVASDWLNERFILKDQRNKTVNKQAFLSMVNESNTKIEYKTELAEDLQFIQFENNYNATYEKEYANNKVSEIVEYTFDNIMKEVTQTKNELEKLDLFNKLLLLSSWEQKLTQFADEDKFATLWKAFNTEIIPLIDQLNITPDMQTLTQQSIINLVLRLTELMDHSIKSMKSSPTYTNKKLQVENFYKMLEPYLRLMEIWVGKVPDSLFDEWARKLTARASYNDKSQILSSIISRFYNTHSREEKQLLPSSQFAVAPACIDSGASFARHFVDLGTNITLEDLFTLMHQNILSATHQVKNQIKSTTTILPETMKPLTTAIESIESSGNKPKLLNTDHHYPILRLEYNLPLRNHSAKIILIYDQAKGTCQIQGKFFGHNESNRMNMIADMANMLPILQDIKNIKPAFHNATKRIVDFTWELNPSQLTSHVQKIKDELTSFANTTFYESGISIHPFLQNNLFTHNTLTKQQFFSLYDNSNFLSYNLGTQLNKLIEDSIKTWSKSDFIEWLTYPALSINENLKAVVLDNIKLLSKDELNNLVSSALKSNRLDLFDLLPDECIPKEKLERKTIEGYLLILSKSDEIRNAGYPLIKSLLKFNIKSEDAIWLLKKLRDDSDFSSIYSYSNETLLNQFLKPFFSKEVEIKDMNEYIISSFELDELTGLRLVPDNFKSALELKPDDFDRYFNIIKSKLSRHIPEIDALIGIFKFKLNDSQIGQLITHCLTIKNYYLHNFLAKTIFAWSNSSFIEWLVQSKQNLNEYLTQVSIDKIKTFSPEELNHFSSLAMKDMQLELLDLLPENYISKQQLERNSIENYLVKIAKSAPNYTGLKGLFKFQMKPEDIMFILSSLRDHVGLKDIFARDNPVTRMLANQFLKPQITQHAEKKDMDVFITSTLESGQLQGLRLIPDHFKLDLALQPNVFEKYLATINNFSTNNEVKYAAVSSLFKFNLTESQIQTLLTQFDPFHKETLLSWAIYMDDIEMAKFLIKRGRDPKAEAENLLVNAVGRRNPKAVELLFEHGVSANTDRTNKKEPILFYVIQRENEDVLKLFLANGKFDLDIIKKCIEMTKGQTTYAARKLEKILLETEAKLSAPGTTSSLEMKKP